MSLLLAILLTLCLASPSWAARMMTTGFEENNVSTTCCWNTVTGTGPTASTSTPHSGTYKMLTGSGATGSYLRRQMTNVTSGSLYTRFYFSTSSASPGADTVFYKTVRDDSATVGMALTLLTTGAITVTNPITTTVATSSTTLTANTWYRIETEQVLSDTVGTITLRLYVGDSTTITETLSITNEDTLPTNIGFYFVGKFTATAVAFSYDDLVINNSAGSAPTSWPGPGKIYLLVPDSNVSNTWEDSAGGTNNSTFANIDDMLSGGAISDADYNADDSALDAADVAGDIDRFGLTDPGAEVTSDATIMFLDVYARAGSNQTSACHYRLKIYDESSAITNGPDAAINFNAFIVGGSGDHLVFDATGKTKTNLNSFNVGTESRTDTITSRPRRVSALWVNVEWIEAAGVAGSAAQSSQGFLGVIFQ